jgi:predicted lipoprotein with Yx(FWY)xxD motif
MAGTIAGAALADNHAVKVSEKDGIGKYLVDAKGMTLYIFKKDSPGKSVCAGMCVEKWPLYYFAGDKAPGDTVGQGVNGVWYVANP